MTLVSRNAERLEEAAGKVRAIGITSRGMNRITSD